MPSAEAGGPAAGFAGASCKGATANHTMSVKLCMATRSYNAPQSVPDLSVARAAPRRVKAPVDTRDASAPTLETTAALFELYWSKITKRK